MEGIIMDKKIETAEEARSAARRFFLRDDNRYGCAESTYLALKTVYSLPDSENSSAAMVLNGGIAYSGGMCGAVSGASMALGELAERRLKNHSAAKRFARRVIQELMVDFRQRYRSIHCRDLIEYDISIPEEHDRFIREGAWRISCMEQIEWSVARLAVLVDESIWRDRVVEVLGDYPPPESPPVDDA